MTTASEERDGGDGPEGPVVVDVAEAHRYEVRVGGEPAGFAAYRDRPGGRRVFTHTEVDDAFEGRGLGSVLVAGAMDDVRARGLTVTPLCPFVAGWLRRHPEHADLLTPRR